MSDIWAVAAVNDHFAASPHYGSPSGDMRLIPDLAALVPLAAAPGWAWAPVDQHDQELRVVASCQRSALRRVVERAAQQGLAFQLAYELELTLLTPDGRPAHDGPGYSPRALLPLEAFALDLAGALEAQGVELEQLHAEYSPGQFELSLGPSDPVTAADRLVLVRLTARQVARRHGLDVSFAPVVLPGGVGNGCHLHLSAWRAERNLLAGGVEGEAAALTAGVLHHLRALTAVLAPSVPGYARLQPHQWAGAHAVWGVENREAALRFIPGSATTRERSANLEVKTVDGAANPYLAAAVVLGAALDGLERGLPLPPPVQDDPADVPGAERLPTNLGQAIAALEHCRVARRTLGDALFEAFVAVRRLEWQTYREADEQTVAAEHRWRYG
jgi:glutamine synthetase